MQLLHGFLLNLCRNSAASSASTKCSGVSGFIVVLRRFNTRKHDATSKISSELSAKGAYFPLLHNRMCPLNNCLPLRPLRSYSPESTIVDPRVGPHHEGYGGLL